MGLLTLFFYHRQEGYTRRYLPHYSLYFLMYLFLRLVLFVRRSCGRKHLGHFQVYMGIICVLTLALYSPSPLPHFQFV